jgi:hypothetical protein
MEHKPIAVLMALLMLFLPGCLLEETHHTLYLDPVGGVTWRVIRDLVRSDRDRLGERADEEAGFLQAVDGGEESWSESLLALGARDVSTDLLRAERPYTLIVRARFDHIEGLLARLLEETDEPLELAYEEDGSLRTLRLVLPPDDELEAPEDKRDEPEGPRDPGAFRIVLTQGRFIEAEGFRLSPDGAYAEPLEHDEQGREPTRLLLVWDVEA